MEINKVQEASAQALTALNAEVAARWSGYSFSSGTGHMAEMCRPPFDQDMARNSRLVRREEEEDDEGNGAAFVALAGLVVIFCVLALLGFIKFIQVML